MLLLSEKWKMKTLEIFQRIAYPSVIGIILLIFRKEQIALLFNFETENYLLNFCSVFLLFIVIFLVFQWIIATSNEFALLQRYSRYSPLVKHQSYFIIIGLTTLLGVMGYYAKDILIFSCIFTIYSFVNICGSWVVIPHIISGFEKHIKELYRAYKNREDKIDSALLTIAKDYFESKECSMFRIIEEYYIFRPVVLRSVVITFISCISLILALIANLGDITQITLSAKQRDIFSILAYIIMILNILVSEIIIALWRKERDKKIEHFI